MASKKPRIICVDDHEDTCFMLSTLFGQLGYEVLTTGDPDDALRLAQDERFDLYILDGHYKGVSRFDLCERVLALDPHAQVVLYSGAAQETERAEGLRAGASAYVVKPDIKGLMATVKQLVEPD
ncbi:MAG: two-component system, OmpR family, alkaline phosphatase synthesis response regulator PhoP [Acidobacteriota bacterium]|jgi:DNA-binding response OmpR family regulator|nr:two-component system, OmpR family, alkaline phosphatase synthesis response regulator PhoP [Acidobacteriota bacterium]